MPEAELTYRDGDRVGYRLSEFIQGAGIVRGVATIPMYGLGAIYIIEDTSGNLPNSSYPFRFFTCPELHLSRVC